MVSWYVPLKKQPSEEEYLQKKLLEKSSEYQISLFHFSLKYAICTTRINMHGLSKTIMNVIVEYEEAYRHVIKLFDNVFH